jgi:tetratricopeptide (TPR) repeat protein
VEEASKLCSQIADKTDLEYIFLKSEILLASEQVDMAEDMLRGKMNDIDDEDELEDYILCVANIYLEYGFPEQVADWLSQSHQNDAYQYREIKATLCYLDEKYDEAERIFNSLLDEDPYDAHIWKYLSKCQFKGERYNESISSCDFALAVTPNDSEAVLIKAAMMFCIENFTEALRYYRRFQELEPHEHAVLPYIAACFHYMGEREQYLTYLKSSCELVPEETNEVLHFFYPDGMDPKDYYRYELQRVENNNVEN